MKVTITVTVTDENGAVLQSPLTVPNVEFSDLIEPGQVTMGKDLVLKALKDL